MGELMTYTAAILCRDKRTAETLVEKFAARKMSSFVTEMMGRFRGETVTSTAYNVSIYYDNVADSEDIKKIAGGEFNTLFEWAIADFNAVYTEVMDELEKETGKDNNDLSGEFTLFPEVYGVALPKSARAKFNFPTPKRPDLLILAQE